MILNTLLFISITMIILVALSNIVIDRYTSSRGLVYSKQSYLVAHSAAEEALYRLKNNINMPTTDSISLSSGSANIAVSDIVGGKKILVKGQSGGYERDMEIQVRLGTGVSFHYGIQSGIGGFDMRNSSSVTGNVFSNGFVTGFGNSILGDVIAAGPTGTISGIVATGTIYAHTLQNSSAEKNAFYQNIDSYTSSHVSGTKFPNSPDQPMVDYPISDAQIEQWEDDAAQTGATCSGGTYTINTDTTIGPLKIPCNLEIKGAHTVVTIKGPIWVVGNITTQSGPTIQMSPDLGSNSVAMIADNPAASTTSGVIDLGQGTTFQGSGSVGSYIFMISQNGSVENGGSVQAINIGQSSSALVAYAAHGMVWLSQSVSLRELTAYKIRLTQSANVVYDTGLANALFEAGPGGSYNILNWLEI